MPFTITRQPTTTSYRGPSRLANGTPVTLAGQLHENHDGSPIPGRTLRMAVGSGEHRQACTGTTNASGTARCTIRSVDQPLNAAATVPVQVQFAGDPYYLPSSKSATALLEYYTGRAYGLTATIGLPLVPLVSLSPTPDTGPVRTARASESTTPCVAEVDAAVLLTSDVVCPKVTTRLAPGTSTSTATVEQTRIGLPGLPVIEVRGATATSTSTCGSGGSATGNTGLELYIGGRRVPVTAEVNAEVDLPGVARLVVNEQKPVAGADHGLTVNAVHLTAAGGNTDIVMASATSDVHNCAR
ncbi:choice-of-anchor P family protein [Actinopolymorpha sp. B11F2]|uniref:choice-of-anchor P family protein n=1 Tax=Actinopolymorpha sp. B11F2 TaxID=3160862 RepID=UPI0032E52E6A